MGQGVGALLLLEVAGLWYLGSERDGCTGTARSRNAFRGPSAWTRGGTLEAKNGIRKVAFARVQAH